MGGAGCWNTWQPAREWSFCEGAWLIISATEKALADENLCAKLILQVHDELIVECPENETEKVCEILRREMESCVGDSFPIPLEVSLASGKTWFDAHG